MAGPAPSDEKIVTRSLRLAIGVSIPFLLGQFIGWPLANIAPVFATLLLFDAEPLPIGRGLTLFATASGFIIGGFLIALYLSPYPALMVIVLGVLVFRLQLYLLASGAHPLAVVALIVGGLLMPILVNLLPEVALVAAVGIIIDFALAILSAWFAFLFVPVHGKQPHSHHGTLTYEEALPAAATLTIVIAPLLVAFLLFGWTDILVLIYATLFATALSSTEGASKGWSSVVANLFFAGAGMLLVYEFLVMAPFLPFAIALIFVACFCYGTRIFSGEANSALWSSGFIGFLLLLGGALLAGEVVAVSKLLDRVFHIFLGMCYVVFAFNVIDLFKSMLSRHLSPKTDRAATNSGTE